VRAIWQNTFSNTPRIHGAPNRPREIKAHDDLFILACYALQMSMKLTFLNMPTSDHNEAFLLYKSALSPVIESAFGWNDDYQKNRFQTRYEPSWFHWIEVDSERIGYICYYETKIELHVSLLIIFDKFRNRAFGKNIMIQLQDSARKQSLAVTLSTFKNNTGAIRFYQKLGYKITAEDDYFYDMALV